MVQIALRCGKFVNFGNVNDLMGHPVFIQGANGRRYELAKVTVVRRKF